MQEQEIWKDVVGYEGLYQVSNLGRVKSIRGRRPSRDNPSNRKDVIMASHSGAARYLGVSLRKEGNSRTKTVHRLVAQAFLPNPLGFPCVNHKDENPLNNRVENLEWCTQEYNANHGSANSKRSQSNSKHAPYYGKEICAFNKNGEFVGQYASAMDAAKELQIASTCKRAIIRGINLCCLGKSASAYGFKWEYAE